MEENNTRANAIITLAVDHLMDHIKSGEKEIIVPHSAHDFASRYLKSDLRLVEDIFDLVPEHDQVRITLKPNIL